jgi:hypothetical protein
MKEPHPDPYLLSQPIADRVSSIPDPQTSDTRREFLMKIGTLSLGRDLYSTKRLVAAGESRGHEAKVIDYERC